MAYTLNWGGGVTNIYTSSWPGNVVYRDDTGPIPSANVAANGNRPLTIYSTGAVSLSGGTAEVVYQSTGWLPGRTFANSTPGGGFRFQVRNSGGTMNVGRCAPDGGTIVDAGDGDTRAGSIPGWFTWSGVPTAPRSLTATANPSVAGRVDLAWTAPASDGGTSVTGYNVYRSGTLIGSTNASTRTYSATGLTPGTSYSFTVRAKNATSDAASTQSQNSNSASATPVQVPNAPTIGTFTQLGPTSARITWTAPGFNGGTAITGYRITYATNSGFSGASILDVGVSGSRDLTGLTPGFQYWFKVQARNSVGNSAYSGTLSGIVVAEIGDLDGWHTAGTLPAGLTPLVGSGLRRGGIPVIAGSPIGLIREIRSTTSSGGPVTSGALRTQRVMTGLTVGATYRLTGNAVSLTNTTPPGNTYAFFVSTVGNGSPVTTSNTSTPVTLPSYDFVATASTMTVGVSLLEAASWSSADWFEDVAFYNLKLWLIPNTSPYRLQDTVYEGPLSQHYSYACNTVGAAWWVDKTDTTRFRQSASDNSTIKATFSDQRGVGVLEYVDIASSYNTRDLVNALTLNNHGRDGVTGDADDTTTLHENGTSRSAFGPRPFAMDVTMRRSTVFDATNLSVNPRFQTDATGVNVQTTGGGTFTYARGTGSANGTAYLASITVTGATTGVSEFYVAPPSAGLVTGDDYFVFMRVGAQEHGFSAAPGMRTFSANNGTGTQGLSVGSYETIPTDGTYVDLAFSGTVPASKLSVRPSVRINTNLPVGTIIKVDTVLFKKGADPVPWFDGASADTVDYTHAWSGTAYLSTSTRARKVESIRAEEVFNAYATPAQNISRIRWNAQEDPAVAASLDIQDRVRVEFGGVVQDSRILGIKHDVTPGRWMIELELAAG